MSYSRQISVDDLTEAIENASDTLSDEEDILKGIVKFGNIDVSEILRPRIDVVALDYKMSIKQVLAVVVDSGYSRIPVYAGNFDNVKGILYVKDLLPYINEKDDFRWQSLIRPPYFVPDTKKVKELLTEFQTSKIHMAVIVDEYGGTLGIVTLEDILEEIVGEISDESDEDEKSYSQINDNTYIFDGKTLLNDFYKILQTETTVFDDIKGEADTLAGLILELKGAIPNKNEQVKYKQFIFKIEAVDSRRIKQIRVTITN
jgi:Hemolysins and related proteins containing CBS domains